MILFLLKNDSLVWELFLFSVLWNSSRLLAAKRIHEWFQLLRHLKVDTSKHYTVKSQIKNYYIIIEGWSWDQELTPCQTSKRLKNPQDNGKRNRSRYRRYEIWWSFLGSFKKLEFCQKVLKILDQYHHLSRDLKLYPYEIWSQNT